jgi:hypothetical protein
MTTIVRCCVLELAAIERAIKGPYQYELIAGRTPWGGPAVRRASQRALLERLRDVRGLNVIEEHGDHEMRVVIAGTIRPDGFKRKL